VENSDTEVNSSILLTESTIVWKLGGRGPDFEALCEFLKENTIPTAELDMRRNAIGNEGARMISESLKINTTLTSLSLWWNDIGAEEARMINESLKINTALTFLNLWYNKIGDEGAMMISESLMNNTTLTELSLFRNNIGDEGAKKDK